MPNSAVQDATPPAAGPTAASAASTVIRLRMWPAILVAAGQWIVMTVPARIAPGTMFHFMTSFLGPLIGALLIVLWWLFASRARWRDRGIVLAIIVAGGGVSALLSDRSIPLLLVLYGIPVVTTLWVAWLAVTQWMNWPARRTGLLVVMLLSWAYLPLIRVDGTDGNINAQTSWRWSPSAEQAFLASRSNVSATGSASSAAGEGATSGEPVLQFEPGDWPEFRGPNRDSRLEGVRINDDWNRSPPKLVWKHRLGPGWGSFAVIGNRLFTQEQRGDDETVACYRAEDGLEQWIHRDTTRFWEVIGGAGPRATPTFHEGRLYTVGANGRLNCLDATTGRPIWGIDMIDSPDVKVPDWGYASSPLVVGEMVLVLPSRPDGAAVQAYDRATGSRLWSSGAGTHGYSSPQLSRIAGVEQILSQTDAGLSALDPATGKVLWHHEWPTNAGARVLQPYVDGDMVLATTYFGIGSRRLRVTRTGDDWSVAIDWESKDFKPYFNDFVVADGHAWGFDANIFCCIDLKTGKRTWKGGRYGYGQVLLLADQKLLLVLSETGEAVLLKADPQRHTEVCRFAALEGKTWNHPVIVRGKLYLRNAGEMACYDVFPIETAASRDSPRGPK
jgi:outer membrane protein assembly factor BamB